MILEDARIFIYGTGGNGLRLSELLKESCRIEGFIDKRAHDIVSTKNGMKVYTISEAGEQCLDKEAYVIFVAVKNVFAHTEIARELLDNGFHRIIYKSDNILKGNASDIERAIDEVYETLVEKKEYQAGFRIPYTDSVRVAFRDRLCIEKMTNEVRTWCPVELLFNYKETNDYPGLNMPLFFPMVELYRFFLGDSSITEEEAVSNFIIYCCEWLNKNKSEMTESQKESFVESRISVFQEMQKMAEVDIDFFRRNCPQVNLEAGRFYLASSGRNRVSFLIAKGFKYVPVKMSKKDYDEWCNLESVRKVEEYVADNNVDSFFAPFPNPYLVDFSFDFVDYQRLFLWPIANGIIKQIYKDNRVEQGNLVITDFDGVERDKQNVKIDCYLQDEGIAERYFESIGLCTDIHSDRERKYLVIDSLYQGKKAILKKNYIKVFYLDRGKRYLGKKDFEGWGYKRKENMFSIMMRCGKICAELYER